MSREWELGRRVLGDARYDEVQKTRTDTADGRLGNRVTGPLPEKVTAVAVEDETEPESPIVEGVSVSRLGEELGKSPELVSSFLKLELARPDQRRSALKLLGKIEAGKPTPDVKVLAEISAALERLDHVED